MVLAQELVEEVAEQEQGDARVCPVVVIMGQMHGTLGSSMGHGINPTVAININAQVDNIIYFYLLLLIILMRPGNIVSWLINLYHFFRKGK